MTTVRTYISRGSWKGGNRAVRREFLEMVFCSPSPCSLLTPPVDFSPSPGSPVFPLIQCLLFIRVFPLQMTTQPSTYRRRSRRQVRINGKEGSQRTLGTLWRKLERGRKRWSWDLKIASLRHYRSSGFHRTLSVSLRPPSRALFYPFPLEGCGTGRVVGKGQSRMLKEKIKSLRRVFDTGH